MPRLSTDRLRDIIRLDRTLQRFTQDSPVLSDVWLAYGEHAARGDGRQRVDLLLTPHRQSSPGELCNWLRRRLSTAGERKRRADGTERDGFGLTYNDSHVVVRLSIGELIRVALPLTKWWTKYVWAAAKEGPEAIKRLRYKKDRARLAESLRQAFGTSGGVQEVGAHDLLWMIRVIGTLSWYGETSRDGADEPGEADLLDAVYRQVRGIDTKTVPEPFRPLLWSVTRNRRVNVGSWKSVSTIKADSATRLFGLRADRLTWAIADSGIDATHPAFSLRNTRGEMRELPPDGDPAVHTRVRGTYDFTRMRSLIEVTVDDGDEASLSPDDLELAQDLQTGLRSGRTLNWIEIEPLLRIEPYRPPVNEHGTHVAGILAGDWREDDDPEAPRERMAGVCPDLNLYDLRVLDDEGFGDEFSVLAALQFVRFLNSGKDQPIIHGVNVSMSIPHDVSNFGCGRTPVCEEAERVVATGVVVVAAAGNQGYSENQGGLSASYQDISITDPGNAETVITVGATHRFKPHTYGVSYFSSRGPTGDGRKKPDLVAPGEKITAPVPGGGAKSLDGTSMAAPHVSGAAALLMACHSELRGQPARIKEILCQSATDLGRHRDFQGYGLVDVLRALQSV